ncbi:unnamed protein product [Durusdinium trenchii]|uniref:Uncharacterized protein n=2 Tax=Durusdinium trenchii TaxID=1381693 RepID=A0ABP0PNS9_9DINO
MGSESPRVRVLTHFSEHGTAPRWVLGPAPSWSPRKTGQRFAGEQETSPGPGRYSPSKSKGLQPSWGFGSGDREWNHLPHDYWPQTAGASPDLYSKQAPVKQRPRSFGRAVRQFKFEIPDTPGPGKVTLDIDVEHPRYPAYSLGGKNEFFWATYATPPSGGRMAQSSHDVAETPGPSDYTVRRPAPPPVDPAASPRPATRDALGGSSARPWQASSAVRRSPFGDRPSPGPGHYETTCRPKATSTSPRKSARSRLRPRSAHGALPRMPRGATPGPQCPPYTQFDQLAENWAK